MTGSSNVVCLLGSFCSFFISFGFCCSSLFFGFVSHRRELVHQSLICRCPQPLNLNLTRSKSSKNITMFCRIEVVKDRENKEIYSISTHLKDRLCERFNGSKIIALQGESNTLWCSNYRAYLDFPRFSFYGCFLMIFPCHNFDLFTFKPEKQISLEITKATSSKFKICHHFPWQSKKRSNMITHVDFNT